MNNWIAVLGSPRRGKNSELLMDYYIQELENQGRKVEKIVLSEIYQNPCKGCEFCINNEVCAGPDNLSMGFIIEAMKRVMIDHGVDPIIIESYLGTKRNPVDKNEDIQNYIKKRVEEAFFIIANAKEQFT